MTNKKLFKVHYCYFLNKINIIIIVICFLLIQLITVLSWLQNVDLNISNELIIENSINSIFTFLKLILVFFCIFIIGNFCLAEKDEYKILYVNNDVKAIKFYITKLLSIDLFLLLFIIFLYFSFLIIGMLFLDTFKIETEFLKVFIFLYLIGLIYGHITIIIMKFLSSPLTFFITFILFLTVDFVKENKVINTFFPSFDVLSMYNYNLNYFVSLLIIILFYFFISLILISGKNS